MKVLTYLLVMLFVCTMAEAKGAGKMEEGDGIHFPRRPLSKTDAVKYIFNRQLYTIYRISNPKFNDSVARDLRLFYELKPNGNFISRWDARFEGVCVNETWLFRSVEKNKCGGRAVYTFDGAYPVTGEGITVSYFTDNPENYVFGFFCLDKTKEIIRKGRRVFCDGPWTLVFLTYEYPPNRVKWFEASKDLWKAYHLSFDNDFIRFEPTGVHCPGVCMTQP